MILPIISAVFTVAEVNPWFLVTYNEGLVTDVLGTVNQGGFGPGQGFNLTIFKPDLWSGIGVMSAYTVILFLTGIVMADRRKME